MKRKNCRISATTPPKYAQPDAATNNNAGRLRGTDPNRNYGGLWGGSGASVTWSDDTFRGDAPFSEPEVQNIRELVSTRQVTNLITNHTYSNLVLRPPGVADFGFPLEEPQYKALGAAMAAHNGYSNDPGFGLYDTTGTTEDWSFWSTGGFAFTFEIGPSEFHPPYATAWRPSTSGCLLPRAPARAATARPTTRCSKATADTALHSVIEGAAPAGSTLRISKTFQTSTSPVWQDDFGTVIGDPIQFPDTLSSELKTTGADVHVAREPVHAPARGRPPRPRPDRPAAGRDHARQPGRDPGARTSTTRGQPYEAIPFTVKGPADGVDNGRFTVHIEWSNPDTDWDIYVIGPNGEMVDAVGGVRRHDRGRHAVRPAARRVHAARGQLRPGAEPARRLVQREA